MHLTLAAILQATPADPYQGTLPTTYVHDVSIWRHMSDALFQSLYRVLGVLIAILPGLLAFVLALVFFTLIGMGLSALLRKGLTAAKFDDRMTRDRVGADWAPAHSPTALIARFSFWACVLLGMIVGVSSIDASYANGSNLQVSMLPYLTHAVGAILLLVAGNVIARFLARTVLIGAVNAQLQYARFLSLGVKWLVLVLTAAMVLDHLQIGGRIVELAFGILFGGIVLTLALAIGLGSRHLVSRSLESHVDRGNDRGIGPVPTRPAAPPENLRHF